MRIKDKGFNLLLHLITVFIIFGCVIQVSKANNILYKTIDINKTIDIKNFGAKGDGKSDDTKSIQSALDYIAGIGGGEVVIPKSTGDFLVKETLYLGANTRLIFKGSFIRLVHYTKVGTVLINRPLATGIEIINPLIDGSNIFAGGTGENGISFGNGGTCYVEGGIIKNCRKGNIANKLGGKAFQIENKNVGSFTVQGTKIYNCSVALSSQFDIAQNLRENTSINVKFNNIYAENCGIFLLLIQVNGFKETKTSHNVSLTNFDAVNCGSDEGVFVFSRACNFKIENGNIKGKNQAFSIIRGRHSLGYFNNINVYQSSGSIINLEPSFHATATTKAEANNYNINILGSTTDVLRTSPNYKYSNRELLRSKLNISIAGSVSNGNFLQAQAISNTSEVSIIDRRSKMQKSVRGNMFDLYNAGSLKSN